MMIRSRLARLVGTLVATTALMFSVQAVAVPGVAGASCIGGSEFTFYLTVNSTNFVTESPVSGTCNGNDYYQGRFNSVSANWRPSVLIQNNGVWVHYWGGYSTISYLYSFRDTNSNSLITLCMDNGATTYCGWGVSYKSAAYPTFDHTFWGSHQGF